MNVGNIRGFLTRYEEAIRRSLLIALTVALPGMVAIRAQIMSDNDIWWHLRTAEWIVEHGAVPFTDQFSAPAFGRPWIAYSWLFELLVYRLYKWCGLSGLIYFTAALSVFIAVALFALVRQLESRFGWCIALTLVGIGGMLNLLLTPRPWLFTILFFIVELNILLSVRRSRDYSRLWLLPPLFALWSNLHIQFVYGFFLLVLVACEPVLNRLISRFKPVEGFPIPTSRLLVVGAACLLATLINPYHYRIYVALLDTISQSGFYDVVSELQAPDFRTLSDWLALGLLSSAALTIGWRRSLSPFNALLLIAGAVVSFRAQRDLWFVVIVAVAVIATFRSGNEHEIKSTFTWGRIVFITLVVCFLLGVTSRVSDLSDQKLTDKLARRFPVAATIVVKERAYTGPLYNHFDWGGYLMWNLRNVPVALDGRGNVHGAERARRSLRVWSGQPRWFEDPELSSARLVIAQVETPLASLLKLDSRFELVYEDATAAVFTARKLTLERK